MANYHYKKALMSLGVVATAIFAISVAATEQGNVSRTLDNVTFSDITQISGIGSLPTWKYGGPAIADLNGDGRYELMVTNHWMVPAKLFWATGGNSYEEHDSPLMEGDVHGIAPGDYDGDGDADLLVSVGGGNGAKPTPPRLLRNDDGKLVDVTEVSGLAGKGARGRAVRWVDLDLDGDLDILQINAPVVVTEDIPRNLMFENIGKGKFKYVANKRFENIDAEKMLVTDFNGDHIQDLVCFTPGVSLWLGTGEMNFIEVSDSMLPTELRDATHVIAAADFDMDNDGDLDLYLARGKTYYEVANNSVSLDAETGRLDLRDEGNAGQDGLRFKAEGSIELHDFFHWPRGVEFKPKVFLGADKIAIDAPSDNLSIDIERADGFPESLDESGWYLGHIGEGLWRFEWKLKENLAWGIRASITGVSSFETSWVPQQAGVPDLLLINEGSRFVDGSSMLPKQHADNNWGVTTGDFNNDGRSDLFVYRFGGLSKRVSDVLMLNQNGVGFSASLTHGATSFDAPESHGDMGAAFDADLDGKVDIFSGDDDQGRWHLYQNTTSGIGNYLTVNVGYSKTGVDSIGAELWLTIDNQVLYRRVGSAGATHSQSVLNNVHFGLADNESAQNLRVRWRDGYEEKLNDIKANTLSRVGQ